MGLAAALGMGKLVASMLYGLKPYDPAILIGAGAVLVAIAVEASWVPAQRVWTRSRHFGMTKSGPAAIWRRAISSVRDAQPESEPGVQAPSYFVTGCNVERGVRQACPCESGWGAAYCGRGGAA